MKSIYTIFFLLLMFLSFKGKAQSAAGCLITSENNVYSTKLDPALVNSVLALLLGSNPIYVVSTPTSLPVTCSYWTPSTTSKSCRICPANNYSTVTLLGVTLISGCNVPYLPGYEGTFTIVHCDIDDHSWALSLAAAALGLIAIRRKRLF